MEIVERDMKIKNLTQIQKIKIEIRREKGKQYKITD